MEEKFIKLIGMLTEDKFYVPTDMHSSGFNRVEICKIESDKIKNPNNMYHVEEENEGDALLTFSELTEKYPRFILDRRLAFYNNFVTWEEYKTALDGQKKITLIEL